MSDYSQLKVQEVLKAIHALKESYRIILTLSLIEGYDYEEICQILDISPTNCRATISRAKESLKLQLQKYFLKINIRDIFYFPLLKMPKV